MVVDGLALERDVLISPAEPSPPSVGRAGEATFATRCSASSLLVLFPSRLIN
jgi:hypothetical protein